MLKKFSRLGNVLYIFPIYKSSVYTKPCKKMRMKNTKDDKLFYIFMIEWKSLLC